MNNIGTFTSALAAMIQQNQPTMIPPIHYRCWCIAALALITCMLMIEDTYAQDFGGTDGGPGITDLQQLPQAPDGGGLGAGGGIGGGIGGAFGGGGDNPFSVDGEAFSSTSTTDLRNQGFVGATGQRIQEFGFVGPAGELSGPPLAENASFGGGVNDSVAGGGGGGGNAGRNQRTGFGAIGQEKGFQVIRKGVRTSLTPRFATSTYGSDEISNRFNNRIRRQPVISNDGGGLNVSVNNRVATVTGFAQSEAERNRFIRQLRLEPGIDQVIDQVSRQ